MNINIFNNNNYIIAFKYFNIIKIIINLIIIIYSFYYENYQYCNNCINLFDYSNSQCFKCTNTLIFKGLKIKSPLLTLKKIVNNNSSISRIGDGELSLIFGKNIGFQKYNKTLAKRLIQIINSNEKNLLIGINVPFQNRVLKLYKTKTIKYYEKFFNKYKFKIAKILNKNKIYYSSFISRFYIFYKKKRNKKIHKTIKKNLG